MVIRAAPGPAITLPQAAPAGPIIMPELANAPASVVAEALLSLMQQQPAGPPQQLTWQQAQAQAAWQPPASGPSG